MLFIFVGLSGAFFVENYRDSREDRRRAEFLAGALYQDLVETSRFQQFLSRRIDEGLRAFEERRARGERPVPFVIEIRGARTPNRMWEMAADLGLGEMEDVDLTFELAFFYNERNGVAENQARYAVFTDEVFWPVALSDTSAFYDPTNGELRGEFQAHMQQLRDARDDLARLSEWTVSLRERLVAAYPGIDTTSPAEIADNRYESSLRSRR